MRTKATSTEYVVRKALLQLLSNDEVARVSSMEGAARLAEGEEYVDLKHPQRGVRRVQATTALTMSEVLPRSAVRDATWSKICARLGQF